jgi:hypothetical protein
MSEKAIGFEAKMPATIMLGRAVQKRVEELDSQSDSGEAGYVGLKQQKRLPVDFGEVDSVRLESLMVVDSEFAVIGVELFGDGSRYVREVDIAAAYNEVDVLYDVVCLPGYPPFAVFAGYGDIQFGGESHYLDTPEAIDRYLSVARNGDVPDVWLVSEDFAASLIVALDQIGESDVEVNG